MKIPPPPLLLREVLNVIFLYFFTISGGRTQIARSPSKKRASFNTGRGRERIRTSSDTDKHLNRVGDNNKSLAGKANLSPSLDAGLASKN